MYYQTDYVLRMIEMMGTFFKRLLEMVDEIEKEELFDDTLRRQCGIGLKTLDHLSAETLIEMLPDQPRFALSEMLYLRTQAFCLADEDKTDCLYKALKLLLSVTRENVFCERRKDRLLTLYQAVYDSLTASDLEAIFHFLIVADAFQQAENVLFDAIETTLGQERKQLISLGLETYTTLLSLPDAQLQAGALPRNEVMQGIEDLKRL